jgi:hypothetical protein
MRSAGRTEVSDGQHTEHLALVSARNIHRRWCRTRRNERALIMTSTIFDERSYDDGVRDAISRVMDDWAFRYPGIQHVEHVYFYGATAAPPETIEQYLSRAYELGKTYDAALPSTSPTSHAPPAAPRAAAKPEP